LAPKPIRKEAGTVGIPSIVVKAANPLRIKSVNGVFALTLTIDRLVKLVIRPMQREVLYRRLVYTAQELSRRSDANLRFAPVAARALDHEDISTFEA